MRPIAKPSVRRFTICLVAVGLGLALGVGKLASSEEAASAKPDVKQLEQKRLEILQRLSDMAQKHWEHARLEFADVLVAKRELLAARLEYAETNQQRVEICDQAIENARQLEQIAKAQMESARGTDVGILRAQAYLLESQIARAKAETGK